MKIFLISLIFYNSYATAQSIKTISYSPRPGQEITFEIDLSNPDPQMIEGMLTAGGHFLKGNASDAMKIGQDALRMSQQIRNKNFEGRCLNLIGSACAILGNHPQGLKYSLEAAHIHEISGASEYLGEDYISLGILFQKRGDYSKSLYYHLKSKDLIDHLTNKELLVQVNSNLAGCYLLLNEIDSAKKYFEQIIELLKIKKDDYLYASVLNSLGMIEKQKYNFQSALDYFSKSDSVYKLLPITLNSCDPLGNIGYTFFALGVYHLAISHLNEALEIAKKTHYSERMVTYYEVLGKIYHKKNMDDSAYFFTSLRNDTKDTIFSTQNAILIKDQEINEILWQQKLEEQSTERKKRIKQTIQYLAIIAIIFFVIFFFYRSGKLMWFKTKWSQNIGAFTLLLIFEFINLVIHSVFGYYFHDDPLIMIGILLIFALILTPKHHQIGNFIEKKIIPYFIQSKLEKSKINTVALEKEAKKIKEIIPVKEHDATSQPDNPVINRPQSRRERRQEKIKKNKLKK